MSRLHCFLFAATLPLFAQDPDPVASWAKDVTIRPVSSVEGRHSIHTYKVTHPAGYIGEVRIYFA
jgi:hypothetical protein